MLNQHSIDKHVPGAWCVTERTVWNRTMIPAQVEVTITEPGTHQEVRFYVQGSWTSHRCETALVEAVALMNPDGLPVLPIGMTMVTVASSERVGVYEVMVHDEVTRTIARYNLGENGNTTHEVPFAAAVARQLAKRFKVRWSSRADAATAELLAKRPKEVTDDHRSDFATQVAERDASHRTTVA